MTSSTGGTPEADLAVRPEATRGRRHPEVFPADTDPFEIDRERIIRCAAFRRLQYKTQVFVNQAGDHYRTRMTHTLEVVQVARRLAAALRVNATLTEAISLAHDLGHPPFGHAGEQALHRLMTGHGGFEHNTHALRVVDYLEHPYPPFRGLNLSWEILEGIIKHRTPYDEPGAIHPADPTLGPLVQIGPNPCIEAQIASLADQVASVRHDLEDAVGAEIVGEHELLGLSLWREAADPVRRAYPDAPLPGITRPVLDELLRRLHDDAVAQTLAAIAAAGVGSADEARAHRQTLVAFSPKVQAQLDETRACLQDDLYGHPRVVRMDHKAARLVEALFGAYLDNTRLLPPRFARRLDDPASGGPHRVICDYIAGMTDRFCQTEYSRLFQPFDWA